MQTYMDTLPQIGPLSGPAGVTTTSLHFRHLHTDVSPPREVASSDDASILEPPPGLPWLTTVAVHEKTRKESAIGCGVLDSHHSGVARGDAAPVLKASVLPKAQHEPQELWSRMWEGRCTSGTTERRLNLGSSFLNSDSNQQPTRDSLR